MRGRRPPKIVAGDPAGETEEELRFHIEMRVRDYREAGMNEDEARAAAEQRLGDLHAVRRELEHLTEAETRSERRRDRLGTLRQDLRYGLRTLLRAPTFSAMSILTLALGIGATTAIFSLVWAVLLAPLPYPQPDRLVRVWETSPQGATRNVVSSGNVIDWQNRTRSFEALGAHRYGTSVTMTGEGDAQQVVAASMQPEVMQALDIAPALGRSLTADDAVSGDALLLSHAMWEGRFGADPGILGRRITLAEVDYTVVGVMPEEFGFPTTGIDFWVTMTDGEVAPDNRTSHNYPVLARLAPGATLESAQAEMDALTAQLAVEYPAEMTGWGARVVPLQDDITRDVASLFWVLLGGVGLVLLIACGNLANLLLARAVARRREMAVRGAMGAGRARILRQLLTESVLLALLGGAGAMIVAPLLLRALIGVAPSDIPNLHAATIDLRMLAFTGAAALGCAVIFGLVPALRLSRANVSAVLRTGRDASQSGHLRLRGSLLVAQVALSVVLLVGTGLFVRSFRALQQVDLGFEPAGLTLMEVDLPGPRYPELSAQAAFYQQLIDDVRGLPGVLAAAGTTQPPGGFGAMTFSFHIEGRVATNPNGREDDEPLHAVSPGYFEALQQELVDGRYFDERDRADGVPVVILNASLARKHFPDGDAVGHRIAFREGETPWREIIGVVDDTRLASPDRAPGETIYIPYQQKIWDWLTWTTVVVRTAPGTDAAALSDRLRTTLLAADPALPPQAIYTVESSFRANTARRTFAMTLVTGFGVLALLLSVVGLYGLITYSVARQRREIGVRMALGAAAGDVVGRVLRRSLWLTLAGAAVGVAGAAAVSRVLETLLFGVSALDALTYASTVGLVVGVALLTAALPATRAARVEPGLALRGD